MKIKKFTALVLVCIMITSIFTGCGEAKNTQDAKKDKKTQKVIKVGLEPSYPPFEFYEEDGTTLTGIDHDLAIEIGKKLGYKMEFVATSWEGIFAGLDKGDYDVIMSAVTITPDRNEKYSFSTPYIKNYQCLVTLADAKVQPKKLDELKGLQVGFQEESTSDTYLSDYMKASKLVCTPRKYAKIIDTFSDLKAKRLDAIIVDSTVADQYCMDKKTYKMTWKQEDEPEKFGICFKKDSELVDDFNKALKELEESGKLKEILTNYFAADSE